MHETKTTRELIGELRQILERARRAERERMLAGLNRISNLASDIRGDWSDPRDECREIQEIIGQLKGGE